MKLDEAIKHAEEVAKRQENNAKNYPRPDKSVKGSGRKYNAYIKCAEEYRQLVGWLKELKLYRETNTVSIDGVLYHAAEPKLKTIHGKTGEVVIGGFKEVRDDTGV